VVPVVFGGAVQAVLGLAALLKLPPEPVQEYPRLWPKESEAETLTWTCPPELTGFGVAVGPAVIVTVSVGPTICPVPINETLSLPPLLLTLTFPVKLPALCGVKRIVTC
jgi:hypothetical protein